MTVLSDTSRRDVAPAPGRVVVLVTAVWSDPCRPAPTLARELARKHRDSVMVVMVDLGEGPAATALLLTSGSRPSGGAGAEGQLPDSESRSDSLVLCAAGTAGEEIPGSSRPKHAGPAEGAEHVGPAPYGDKASGSAPYGEETSGSTPCWEKTAEPGADGARGAGLVVHPGEPLDRDALIDGWGITELPTWIAFDVDETTTASADEASMGGAEASAGGRGVREGGAMAELPGTERRRSCRYVESGRLTGALPKHEVERTLFRS